MRKASDPLLAIAARIEQWMIKVADYGEESVNYQNGDSPVFSGDAWEHHEKMKRELARVLRRRGVKIKDQLEAIHKANKGAKR